MHCIRSRYDLEQYASLALTELIHSVHSIGPRYLVWELGNSYDLERSPVKDACRVMRHYSIRYTTHSCKNNTPSSAFTCVECDLVILLSHIACVFIYSSIFKCLSEMCYLMLTHGFEF